MNGEVSNRRRNVHTDEHICNRRTMLTTRRGENGSLLGYCIDSVTYYGTALTAGTGRCETA